MLVRLLSFFVVLITIALSIKSLREPDLWWMFRTGEWMMANGQVPQQDIFSYTHQGVEWVNVKWLFELLISVFKSIGGPEFVFALQASVSGLILWLAGKKYRLVAEKNQMEPNWGLFALGFMLALLALDFRMIARPEMCSHALTAVFLFLFLKYDQTKNAKYLYSLIPLQALWANLHEGFGVGMVMLGAWLFGQMLAYVLDKTADKKLPLLPAAVVVIACLSVALHPCGLRMIWHPYYIFTQLQDNKFTTELLAFTDVAYWNLEAYLNLGFLAVSALGLLLVNRAKSWGLSAVFQRISPSYLLLYGLFFYLSLTAYRNIPFFIVLSLPYVVIALQAFFEKYIFVKIQKERILYFSLGLSILFYAAIVSGYYHSLKASKDRYGMQVLNSHNPTGAADFLLAHGLQDKKTFSDYLTSSYLLWRLQPNFKTYIDLRDLDIFPTSFFQTFAEATVVPESFNQQDSLYQFNQVVLLRTQFVSLHSYLAKSENYDLVFADAVAAVYLKKNVENQAIISKFGFKANNNKDIFSDLQPNQSSSLAYAVSKIINPLFSVADNKDLDNGLFAGEFYKVIGQTNLAIARAQKSVQTRPDNWQAHGLLANIYNSELSFTQDPTQRSFLVQSAGAEYDKALKINPKAVDSWLGKGLLLIQQGQHGAAIKYLEKAVELDYYHFQANKYLAFCYKLLYFNQATLVANLDKWLFYSHKLDKLNPDNPFIIFDLGLGYCVKNKCEQANFYLQKVKDFPQFSDEEKRTLQDCLKKCAQ